MKTKQISETQADVNRQYNVKQNEGLIATKQCENILYGICMFRKGFCISIKH